LKLDFQHVAEVVNRYISPENAANRAKMDSSSSSSGAGSDKYSLAKAEAIATSLGHSLKNASGKPKTLPELLDLIDQSTHKLSSAQNISGSSDGRVSSLERELSALKAENERLRSSQHLASSSSSVNVDQVAEERRMFHAQLKERQEMMESLLRTQQESADALELANNELAELREQVNSTDDQRNNKVYELNRALSLASGLNKEHANALGIAAKKLIKMEQVVNTYKHSVKDVAKTLGETMTSLATEPMTKEELDALYSTAMEASPDAPDAIFTLRIAERIASGANFLDTELQLALADVPQHIREMLKKIPSFDESLYRHVRSSSTNLSDTHRLLNSIEEACTNFDLEFESIQIDEV
jgi:small-conductance mechanosensitive channel